MSIKQLMCSLQNQGLFDIIGMKTASFAMKKSKFSWKRLQSRGQWVRGANGQDAISDGNMYTGNPFSQPGLSPLENLEMNCLAFPQHFLKNAFLQCTFC